jgi:1,2-diacylglycerol 3-alpha-glucosyltransferase
VQSIPTLQAAATGLPIVAADAAALPELVHNDRNGFLVPPGEPEAFVEAIRKILDHPENRSRFAQSSLSIARQHSDEQTFHDYEMLFQEIGMPNAEMEPSG